EASHCFSEIFHRFVFLQTELKPGSRIVRQLLYFQAKQFQISIGFFLPRGFLCELSKVMNSKIGVADLEVQRVDSMFDKFVYATDKVNLWISPKQSAIFVDEICRSQRRSWMGVIVRLGDAVPASSRRSWNVITDGD